MNVEYDHMLHPFHSLIFTLRYWEVMSKHLETIQAEDSSGGTGLNRPPNCEGVFEFV